MNTDDEIESAYDRGREAGMDACEPTIEDLRAEVSALQSRLEQSSKDADTLHRVIDRLEAENAELLADSNGCRSRLGTLREALECLLPGLVLDLRYADQNDDRDALQSRIKTVTDALAVDKPCEHPKTIDTDTYGKLCLDCGEPNLPAVVERQSPESRDEAGLTASDYARIDGTK